LKMRRSVAVAWIVLVGIIVSAPLTIAIFAPRLDWKLENEMRARAAVPHIPWSARDWRDLPAKIDAFFRDRFGLREELIHLHALLTQRLLRTGNTLVQIGNRDRLFLRSDEMVQQSAGLVLREQRVRETADTIENVREVLASKGIKFIFASPPNSATIYSDVLPGWARNHGGGTEYDAMLEALAKRNIEAVDLRPLLRAARTSGSVYFRHDTHWSARGAVVGFNSVAAALGHRDWQLDLSTALGPPAERRGGDLARMLGIAQDMVELTEPLKVSVNQGTALKGPQILILGDSFTAGFEPFLLANGARFQFVHHTWCGFDWNVIEENNPDEVWWMPTERYMLCNSNVRPKGLPVREKPTKMPLALVAK
jgi:alginate O-acetyltransferase complex protein AlgJ